MKIETKYSVGDKVWVMYFGQPKEIEITIIIIVCSNKGVIVTYQNEWLYGATFPESFVYTTKEELLNSL